jgi:hypothetical protein
MQDVSKTAAAVSAKTCHLTGHVKRIGISRTFIAALVAVKDQVKRAF